MVIKMKENFNWDIFLQPYELAISGFIIKLESMKKQYILKEMKNPIESITGRVKTPNSILEKAKRLNVHFDDIPDKVQDIAGIRILCKYIKDVYRVFDLLTTRKDIEIVYIKDYIKNPKPSGYRSLHLIAKYNVETLEGQHQIYLEFQIRTLAMHLWASIEHSLKYKYYRNIPESIKLRLQVAAEITVELENEMSNIQNEVETLENGNTREDYETEWELNTIHRGKL
jgi:putative GTP pyrophosphokinase